jgi:hypothetical protein
MAHRAKKPVRVPAKPAAKQADGEAAILAKIAQMPDPYRIVGKRLRDIIMKSAPGTTPRVRYGMPWYSKHGKSWCFFRAATSFNLMTFGFDDPAILVREEGATHQLIGSAYRITTLDEATADKLSAIVRKDAG